MRNSLTSRFKKTYKVKYYYDINVDTKKWEVIELPSNSVIQVYDFKEDGSLELKTTLFGKMTGIKNIINILDNKYYSKLKKKNNIWSKTSLQCEFFNQ